MLSEIVAILIREYQRRGQLDKVKELIEKHRREGGSTIEKIELEPGFSLYSVASRSPLKDRRLLKFERHRQMKVSKTLRLTQAMEPTLPLET